MNPASITSCMHDWSVQVCPGLYALHLSADVMAGLAAFSRHRRRVGDIRWSCDSKVATRQTCR